MSASLLRAIVHDAATHGVEYADIVGGFEGETLQQPAWPNLPAASVESYNGHPLALECVPRWVGVDRDARGVQELYTGLVAERRYGGWNKLAAQEFDGSKQQGLMRWLATPPNLTPSEQRARQAMQLAAALAVTGRDGEFFASEDGIYFVDAQSRHWYGYANGQVYLGHLNTTVPAHGCVVTEILADRSLLPAAYPSVPGPAAHLREILHRVALPPADETFGSLDGQRQIVKVLELLLAQADPTSGAEALDRQIALEMHAAPTRKRWRQSVSMATMAIDTLAGREVYRAVKAAMMSPGLMTSSRFRDVFGGLEPWSENDPERVKLLMQERLSAWLSTCEAAGRYE